MSEKTKYALTIVAVCCMIALGFASLLYVK